MSETERLPDADINAYVDGELDARGLAEVESWLAAHPQDAARVHAYKLQKVQLRRLYDADAAAPLPKGVQAVIERDRRMRWLPDWRKLAAGIVLLVLGGLGGWSADALMERTAAGAGSAFVQRALNAHVVYAHDEARPVEIGVSGEADLVSWLSERIGQPLKTPDLAGKGFRLIGGRLVADNDAPAALFMYEDTRGRRVTLYMRSSMEVLDSKFRFVAEHGMVAFYWTDGKLACALTGEMPRGDLLMLAQMVLDDMEAKTS